MMLQNKSHRHRGIERVLLVMAVPIAFLLLFSVSSTAEQMQNRSVRISSAEPSAVVSNNYTFDVASTDPIASISFEYCANSPLVDTLCVAPAGLDTSSATLSSQTGNTGFSLNGAATTANKLVISRPLSAASTVRSTYAFGNVINPSTVNQTVYVRVTTHATSDSSDPYIDEGSVAYSTSERGFSVGAFVPPRLTFCVALTVAIDCSSTGTVLSDFGELSESRTATTTNQFAVATNDFNGYDVYFEGSTLTAGNSIVNPLTTRSSSSIGTSQFGFNLRGNSSPSVGSNVTGRGTGQPTTGYNTPNQFKFSSGDLIARSNLSSDYNRFTASYIVNVPDGQPAGVYATTITYLAVVSF